MRANRKLRALVAGYGLFLGLIWGVGIPFEVEAQQPSKQVAAPVQAPTAELLAQLCQVALDSFGAPGLSVGVIKDGQIVLNRGFGVSRLGNGGAKGTPIDEHTVFAIASNTKAFVGTTVALLAAEGKLSLNDLVSQRLPYLKFADPHVTALANVTDLLTHRSGLGTFMGDHLWFKRTVAPEGVLTQVAALPMEYPFRAGYGYSNVGFIAAGEVIRGVTGGPWEAFAKTRFWDPLGMTRTWAHVRDLPQANVAFGHVTRQLNAAIAPVPWENSGAAGGMWSTSHDLLRWVEANLGKGTFRGTSVWPADVQASVWKPYNVFGAAGDFSSYGLGWFLSNVQGHAVMSHGGGYDGQYSQVMLVPDLGLGIVVLSNSMTGLPAALSRHIRDLYLGTASDTWLETASQRDKAQDSVWFARQQAVDQRLAAARGQTKQVAEIVGSYRDASFGDFKVSRTAVGELRLDFPRSTLLGARLEYAGGDLYRLAWDEQHAWFDRGAASFERDAKGEIHLKLDIPNEDIFYDGIDGVKGE